MRVLITPSGLRIPAELGKSDEFNNQDLEPILSARL